MARTARGARFLKVLQETESKRQEPLRGGMRENAKLERRDKQQALSGAADLSPTDAYGPGDSIVQHSTPIHEKATKIGHEGTNVRSVEALGEVNGALASQWGVLISLSLLFTLARHFESEKARNTSVRPQRMRQRQGAHSN